MLRGGGERERERINNLGLKHVLDVNNVYIYVIHVLHTVMYKLL